MSSDTDVVLCLRALLFEKMQPGAPIQQPGAPGVARAAGLGARAVEAPLVLPRPGQTALSRTRDGLWDPSVIFPAGLPNIGRCVPFSAVSEPILFLQLRRPKVVRFFLHVRRFLPAALPGAQAEGLLARLGRRVEVRAVLALPRRPSVPTSVHSWGRGAHGKRPRARSRLYRCQILKVRMRLKLKALAEIYKLKFAAQKSKLPRNRMKIPEAAGLADSGQIRSANYDVKGRL